MNKRVFIAMLILSISFLISMYVLKIFYPQEFMMSIQNEKLIQVGTFIDSHEVLYYICCGITSFVTYWLYCCACKGSLKLKWYEVIEILVVVVGCRVVNFYDVNMATAISVSSFVFLPALMKGNLTRSAIVYTTHCVCQILSLQIRSLPMYLVSANFVTIALMTFECYFWLLLFYVIFNYKAKEK